jgi:hypothetical protein
MDPVGGGIASGVTNAFQAFLGPPKSIASTDPFDQRSATTMNMPEAYYGKSRFLGETVIDWMWTSHQRFYTEILLPLEEIDDIHVTWTTWEANAHLLGPNPHQAPSRIVSQKRTSRRASLNRLGLSVEFEHDFVRTGVGRRSFALGVGQLGRSTIETMNHEVTRALLDAHRFNQQYVRENGYVNARDFMELLRQDNYNFFLWQKEKNGPAKWDANNDMTMSMYRGTADSILLPEPMMVYATLARPEVTDYYLRGQRGPDAVDNIRGRSISSEVTKPAGRERLEPQVTLNLKNVYVARAYHVDNVGNTDLLARVRQIGEYNIMSDDHIDYQNGTYHSSQRNILIYNEDIDDFSEITLRMALDNCELFDGQGNLRAIKATSQNPNIDAAIMQRDQRLDFLSMIDSASNKAVPITHFGQMDPAHLTAEALENIGRTTIDAMFKGMPAEREAAEREFNEIKQRLGETLVYTEFNDNSGAQKGTVTKFVNRLVSTLGKYQPSDSAPAGTGTGLVKSFIENNFLFGRVPVVRSSGRGVEPLGASVDRGQKLDIAFLKSLLNGIPESESQVHAAALDLAKDETIGTPLQRAELIKEATLRLLPHPERADWANHGDYNSWYNEQVRAYKQTTAAAARAQPVAASAAGAHEVGLALPGQDLSDGWTYAFPEDAHRSPSYSRDVPASFAEFPSVHVAAGLAAIEARGDARANQRSRYAQSSGGFGMVPEQVGILQGDEFTGETAALTAVRTALGVSTFAGNRFSNAAQSHLDALDKSASSLMVKLAALHFLTLAPTKSTFENLIRNNILFPMQFIIARPHATYRTRILIKLLANGGSGKMYMGHASTEIGHDASRMVGLLHFAVYMAAVVYNPHNVYVQPDMYVDRYLGGLGVKFFTPLSYSQASADGNTDSIIVLPIPHAERHTPNPMDVSGRWYTAFQNDMISEADFNRPHYSTLYRMNGVYRFTDTINFDDEIDEPIGADTRAQLNRVMWRGMTWRKASGKYDIVQPNTGHFGPDVYTNVGKVRAGAIQYVEPQNWSSKFSVL